MEGGFAVPFNNSVRPPAVRLGRTRQTETIDVLSTAIHQVQLQTEQTADLARS